MTTAEPLSTHLRIVFLQADFCPGFDFDLPEPYSYTKKVYQQTKLSELHERIHDASILVISAIKLDAVALSPAVSPNLKLIAVLATGTDCIDLDACRARGIVVSNCQNTNMECVSEHAIGLYFATRRRICEMNNRTRAGDWLKEAVMCRALDQDRRPPLTCSEEVAGIIGFGGVGKRIANLARGLGMRVLVAGRKDSHATNSINDEQGVDRTSYHTVMEQATVLFVAVPLTASTRNLISNKEFEKMSRQTLLVNVSRGGVVDEEALVKALSKGYIAGAATDVFYEEPAGPENSPLLRDDTKDMNIIVTPHMAWLGEITWKIQLQVLKQIVEQWAAGKPLNVVV